MDRKGQASSHFTEQARPLGSHTLISSRWLHTTYMCTTTAREGEKRKNNVYSYVVGWKLDAYFTYILRSPFSPLFTTGLRYIPLVCMYSFIPLCV